MRCAHQRPEAVHRWAGVDPCRHRRLSPKSALAPRMHMQPLALHRLPSSCNRTPNADLYASPNVSKVASTPVLPRYICRHLLVYCAGWTGQVPGSTCRLTWHHAEPCLLPSLQVVTDLFGAMGKGKRNSASIVQTQAPISRKQPSVLCFKSCLIPICLLHCLLQHEAWAKTLISYR